MSTPFFGRTSIHIDKTKVEAPHLVSKIHAHGRQWQKTAALIPLGIAVFAAQGFLALTAVCAAVSGALVAEALGAWFFKRPIRYHDGESIFFGLFCALLLPWTLSAWVFFAAAAISVFFGREIFGGFGQAILFPPAIGLLILFMSLPQMIQSLDYKSAKSLTEFAGMSAAGVPDLRSFLFYPSSAAAEDVSLAAIAVGGLALSVTGLVAWPLLLWCSAGYGIGCWVFQNQIMGLSGGLWLILFWGLTQTSAMPLRPRSRWLYAVVAGFVTAACPLNDPALCGLVGLGFASLLAPWLDLLGALRFDRQGEPG